MRNLLIIFLTMALFTACRKPMQMKVIHGDKILIVNADDLCLNDETDKAIVNAYQSGIVTSTSAFITFKDPIITLQNTHRENPDLPIGLHLNLTEGKPVLPAREIPSLVDKEGNFYPPEKIISKLHDMNLDEVRSELNAQVNLFLSSGVPLDHINCHHHLAALYTPFHAVMREISLHHKVPMRNPVPYSIYKKMKVKEGGGGSFAAKSMIKYGILHPFKSIPMMKLVGPSAFVEQEKIDAEAGIEMPDWFIDGFFDNATVSDLDTIIQQLPQGISELMCHPGRYGEGIVLSNPEITNTLEKYHVKLGQFDVVRK